MRKYFLAFIATLLVLSCSKTAQDQSTTDTTAVNQSSAQPKSYLIEITPEIAEEIRIKLFNQLHFQNISEEDTSTFSQYEDLNINGRQFDYTIVRNNGRFAGLHVCDWRPGEEDYQDIEKRNEQNRDPDAEEKAKLNPEVYAEPKLCLSYTNETDTIRINGNYSELEDMLAENGTRSWRLMVAATSVFTNSPTLDDDRNVTWHPEKESLSYIYLQEKPLNFSIKDLYLKARMLPITEADLQAFSKDDIIFLRNEIFARHGHTFKTDKMIAYFNQQPWYFPSINDATSLLNQMEKLNVEFLKKIEGTK